MTRGACQLLFLVTALIVRPVSAQQNHPVTREKADVFHRCASEVALSTMRNKDEEIGIGRVANEVISACLLKMPDDVLLGQTAQRNAWLDRAKHDVVALVVKLQPQAMAEKAEVARTRATYFSCLENHARILALNSSEAADIVVQASLSSCPLERAAIFEVRSRYGDSWSEEAMTAMNSVLAPRLLVEVVEVRALRNLSPMPNPKSSKAPI